MSKSTVGTCRALVYTFGPQIVAWHRCRKFVAMPKLDVPYDPCPLRLCRSAGRLCRGHADCGVFRLTEEPVEGDALVLTIARASGVDRPSVHKAAEADSLEGSDRRPPKTTATIHPKAPRAFPHTQRSTTNLYAHSLVRDGDGRIRSCAMVMVITNSVEYGQKLGVLSFNLQRAAGETKGKGRSLGNDRPSVRACLCVGYRSLGVCGKGASMSGLGNRRRAYDD